MAKEAGPRAAYTRAGVDVDAGERAVALMRRAVESTHGPTVLGGLGGFGGAVAIPAGYREPVPYDAASRKFMLEEDPLETIAGLALPVVRG